VCVGRSLVDEGQNEIFHEGQQVEQTVARLEQLQFEHVEDAHELLPLDRSHVLGVQPVVLVLPKRVALGFNPLGLRDAREQIAVQFLVLRLELAQFGLVYSQLLFVRSDLLGLDRSLVFEGVYVVLQLVVLVFDAFHGGLQLVHRGRGLLRLLFDREVQKLVLLVFLL